MTSIRFKIVFLFLAMALGEAIVLGVLGYNSVNATARASADFRQIVASLEETRLLNLALSRAESQIKAFSLRHDRGSLEGFNKEWKEVETRLRNCSTAMCHGVVEQPARMMEKIRPSTSLIGGEREKIMKMSAGDPAISESVRVIESEAEGIVDVTGQMAEKVLERVRTLEEESQASRDSALVLMMITTFGTAFLAMLLCYPVVNSITRPVYALVEGVRRIAPGEMGHRVAESGTKETVLLARSFNQMADNLEAHQAWLQEEIRRRDVSLSQSEKLATIGLLASSVGHELNNPLTSLLMNAKLALEECAADDKVRPLLEEIASDAERCRVIVADLRLMGRHRVTERCECDLVALVEDALRIMRLKAESRGVTLHPDLCPKDVLRCVCDREKIVQVVVNLIDNAVDVSQKGGRVDVRVRPAPPGAVIEVTDQGCGIPKEQRDRIFERFFTTKEHGLGLGLAMCQHIVREQRGKIEFESVSAADAQTSGGHAGTTFRVSLPLNGGGVL